MVGSAGGPTLRVYDAAGRELLRFDCFARGAHWHADPGGRDARSAIASDVDPVAWALTELRRDLAGYLGRAGYASPEALDPEACAAALDRVEKALCAL